MTLKLLSGAHQKKCPLTSAPQHPSLFYCCYRWMTFLQTPQVGQELGSPRCPHTDRLHLTKPLCVCCKGHLGIPLPPLNCHPWGICPS